MKFYNKNKEKYERNEEKWEANRQIHLPMLWEYLFTQNNGSGITGFKLACFHSKHQVSKAAWYRDTIRRWFPANKDFASACHEMNSTFFFEKEEDIPYDTKNFTENPKGYVWAMYNQWFYGKIRQKQVQYKYCVRKHTDLDYQNLKGAIMCKNNVEESLIWMDLLEKYNSILKDMSIDSQFFAYYPTLPDEDKNSYWSEDRKKVTFNGKTVGRQTFYNRLSRFKDKMKFKIMGGACE